MEHGSSSPVKYRNCLSSQSRDVTLSASVHEPKRVFAAEETRHASLLRRILLLPRTYDSQNFMALLVATLQQLLASPQPAL